MAPAKPGSDERLLLLQTRVLERIARGAELRECMETLAELVESEHAGSRCGICVLDPDRRRIARSYGPSLPPLYQEALVGVEIPWEPPFPGPCSQAMRDREVFTCKDIREIQTWANAPWGKLLIEEGFLYCRSTPILDAEGRSIGSITLYLPGAGTGVEPAGFPYLSHIAAHLAAIAIEREAAELALRGSESQLRTAMEAAHLGDWEYNVLTGAIRWSERCLELFHLPQGSTYSQFLDNLHEDDRDRVNQSVELALRNSIHYSEEYRVRQPDGGYRWLASMGRGVYNDDGEMISMRGIAFDISGRKSAEELARTQSEHLDRTQRDLRQALEAVEISAERFRFLAESLPAKIFTADANGHITYLNQQWATYTGRPLQVVESLGWREFVHPLDMDEKHRVWTTAVKNGTPFEFEHRFRRADGQYRWHLSRAQPMRDAQGNVLLWIGTNTDVHDLKQAQFELEASESRVRLAVEAAGIGYWDWDIGNTIHWSTEHNRIMGLDPLALEGTYQELLERIHPDDRSHVMERLEHSELTGEDYEAEFRVVWPDGSLHWVAGHGRPFFEPRKPRAVRMLGVVRDITERKVFEDLLGARQEELKAALAAAEHARDEAEAGNRAKDHFLAVLSHELRTPLTPVLMAASTMLFDPNLDEETRETLEMIRRNIQLESRLINDLLDLTRITRNQMDLQMERLDLHQVIQQAVEVCRGEFEAKPLHLEVKLDAEHHAVQGDAARLQQVFWNLFKNAVKFTPSRGRVEVRTVNENGYILIMVTDTGIGIPPEVLPLIFNPFEQGNENFARQFGGLGLGLAISEATIDAHDGTLVAQSPGDGMGSTFTVKLKYLPP